MCTNRLYIHTNSLDFNPVVDRLYNYVPCGKCEECLQTKAQDLATRLAVHSQFLRKINGVILYFTLTYDRWNLPSFKGKPVFSKSHVDKFIDNFRHSSPLYKNSFDYFICSEYGGKTFRPHYHVLFFLKRYPSLNDVRFFIDKFWPYGRVDFSKNNGLVLGSRPAKYVTKYVTKDPNFCNYLNKGKRFTEEDLFYFKYNQKTLFADLSILPFHRISNGVGFSLVETLQFTDFVNGYFFLSDDTGFHKKTMIPDYIVRKVLKYTYRNKNGNISYRYNDYGLKVLRARLIKRFESLYQDYLHLFDFGLFHFHEIQYLKTRFAYDEFKVFCKNYASSEFCKQLATYSLLYRGLDQSVFSGDFLDDLDFYIDCYRNDVYIPCSKFYENKIFDSIITVLDEIRVLEDYKIYLDRQNSYNVKQLLLSKKTGKYKPAYIKDFYHFNDFKFDNKCLIMLTGTLVKSA